MSYNSLQSDFSAYAKRTDLDSLLPRFVALFEERVNRRLRLRQQETAFSGTIASGVIALPADWLAFKQIKISEEPLNVVPLEYTIRNTGQTATAYAIDGANVRFNGSGSVTGTYFAKVPSLQTNTTNWLSSIAYDAYLFGALSEAMTYAFDEQRAQLYGGRADAILNELIVADQRDRNAGPITARAR